MNFIKDKFLARGYATLDLPVIPFSERNYYLMKIHNMSQTSNKPLTIFSKFDINKKICTDLQTQLAVIQGYFRYQKTFISETCSTHFCQPQKFQTSNKLAISLPTDLQIHPSPTITTKHYPAKNISCRRDHCACCSQLKGSA